MFPGVEFPGVMCTTSPGGAQLEHAFRKNSDYRDIADFFWTVCQVFPKVYYGHIVKLTLFSCYFY